MEDVKEQGLQKKELNCGTVKTIAQLIPRSELKLEWPF